MAMHEYNLTPEELAGAEAVGMSMVDDSIQQDSMISYEKAAVAQKFKQRERGSRKEGPIKGKKDTRLVRTGSKETKRHRNGMPVKDARPLMVEPTPPGRIGVVTRAMQEAFEPFLDDRGTLLSHGIVPSLNGHHPDSSARPVPSAESLPPVQPRTRTGRRTIR